MRHAGTAVLACREGTITADLGVRLVATPGTLLVIPEWMTHRVWVSPDARMDLIPAPEDRRVDGLRVRPRIVPGTSLRDLPEPAEPEPVLRALARVHELGLTQGAGEIADGMGYSLTYLTTLLTRTTGRSLGEWVTQTRLDHAAHLLRHTSSPVPQVAADSGFADPSHFRRTFRARRGVAPSHWRNHGTL